MQSRHVIIATIGIILFLLPSIVGEAVSNTIAANSSSNGTEYTTSAIWDELHNLTLATGTGNVTLTASWDAKVNYSMARMYGRFLRDGVSLGTFNITSNTYSQAGTYTADYTETAGTHYYGFQVYATSGRKGSIYSRNFTVQFLTTGAFANMDTVNASAQVGISQVSGLQTAMDAMNSTAAVNDTNINGTIASITSEFRTNDTNINGSITGLQTNDTLHDSRFDWVNNTYLPNSTYNDNFPNSTFQGKIDSANESIAAINSTKANKTGDSVTFETTNTSNLNATTLTNDLNANNYNFTNASNLQAPASSIVAPCPWNPANTCIVNGTTRNLDFMGDNQTVIESALANNKNIYLAEGVIYVPSSDTIPAYAHITCSGNTSIIQPGDPTTTVLKMGAYSSITNCGIKTANQAGMESSGTVSGDLRMAYNYVNNRNVTETMSWWPGKAFAVVTGYHGLDQPGISCLLYGVGDCYWAGTNDTGVAFRISVNSLYPTESGTGILLLNYGNGKGIYINNSMGDATKTGAGIWVDNFGQNPGVFFTSAITTAGDVIRITPKNTSGTGLDIRNEAGKPVANLMKITANTNVTNDILVTSATQQTGKIIQVYNAAVYQDDVIYLDMGRGSGSFSSGYFIRARNGATDKFLVGNNGSVTISEFAKLNANTTDVCMVAGDDGKIYKNNTDGELYYCDGGTSEILSTP